MVLFTARRIGVVFIVVAVFVVAVAAWRVAVVVVGVVAVGSVAVFVVGVAAGVAFSRAAEVVAMMLPGWRYSLWELGEYL